MNPPPESHAANTYVGVLTFVGSAEKIEDFLDTVYAALRGDAEAHKRLKATTPTVIAIPGAQLEVSAEALYRPLAKGEKK